MLFELQEVLTRSKFRRYVTYAETLEYVLWIHDGAAEVSGELLQNVVVDATPDPDDDYLAGVTLLGEADFLISGDRHLLDLGAIRDGEGKLLARILTPREFLEELERRK